MRKQVSIAQARDGLARLVHEAEAGSTIELTRRGETVAVIAGRREFERLSTKRSSFSAAFRKFRRANAVRRARIDPALFDKVRDRAPGRKVIL